MAEDIDKSGIGDSDMEGALPALIRAGKRAKLLAAFAGTPYVTFRNGEILSEIPNLAEVLKEQNAEEGWQLDVLKHFKNL